MSNIDKRALRDSAESTIGILENIAGFEPSDIDGDIVELRFETEDGFDTGCDVSIVDQCQKAADVVRALLDELEAKDKYISELKSAVKSADDRYENRTPTQWAYDQACLALEKHRARAEAAEKRIAEQRETLLAARSHVMQCARMGDAHANGVLQAIDRAAAGKGE